MLLRSLLHLHTFLYKAINRLARTTGNAEHPKHNIIAYRTFFLHHLQPTDTVLDIGCGKGTLTRSLAPSVYRIVGIDTNPAHQKYWRQDDTTNTVYHIADGQMFTSEATFSVVILSNVLEHIEHRVAFLKHIQHLAPKFLIRVPMINRDWITLYKKELGLEYRLDQTHFIEYTLESFQTEITEAGYKVQTYSIQFGEIWAVVTPIT